MGLTFAKSASCTSGTRTGARACLRVVVRKHCKLLAGALGPTRSLVALHMLELGELAVAQAALLEGHGVVDGPE